MPSFFFHLTVDLAIKNNLSPLAYSPRDIFSTTKIAQQHHPKALSTPAALAQSASETQEGVSIQKALKDSQSLELDIRTTDKPSPATPSKSAHLGSSTAETHHDWRYGNIVLQEIDMLPEGPASPHSRSGEQNRHIMNGIGAGPSGLATKGRYEPSDIEEEELGWGIVRLYRDSGETPGLYDDIVSSKSSNKHGRGISRRGDMAVNPAFRDEDCTTLCILAVPSYLTPSDFLGFVGEKTREEVSHFRMIRTERVNRYMVLMKFRNGKKAREWRKEWNGKAFNSTEPENCHVVFVKSIEFRALETPGNEASFPDMTNDPFTPSATKTDATALPTTKGQSIPTQSTSLKTKPIAPPTPALIELPTCPVCLERMDESTGLLTILCQHVFHCSCLQKWLGSGCPVCRYTQDPLSKRVHLHNEGSDLGLNECSICRSDANLWICLICGNVGCGRYDAAHAFLHYQQSTHCFAMDLNTQRVWDYASDGYVHRIVQSKTDGKLVELPSATTTNPPEYGDPALDDFVPREKLDAIGHEYIALLTSQLDSQRLYFEEKLERAADKASEAGLAALSAAESSSLALSQLDSLSKSHEALAKETIPALERDRDRAVRKAEKFETMARKLEKEWREEKAMGGSLLERVKHLEGLVEGLRKEKAELEEVNRDLSFFISGQEKLKELGEEVVEGTVSLPEERKGGGGRRGKGKGKKGGGGEDGERS